MILFGYRDSPVYGMHNICGEDWSLETDKKVSIIVAYHASEIFDTIVGDIIAIDLVTISKQELTDICFDIIKKVSKIDMLIEKNLIGWRIDRIAQLVTNTLRIAIYEIMQCANDNEAACNYDKKNIGKLIRRYISVIKIFGEHVNVKFVNGILDKIFKTLCTKQYEETNNGRFIGELANPIV